MLKKANHYGRQRAIRLTIVVSHPIPYFVHSYRAIAADPEIDLTVLFCSKIGLERYFDRDFNVELAWKTDLLSNYRSIFLDEADRIKSAQFGHVNNPSVSRHLDQCSPDAVMIYGYSQLTQLRVFWWAFRRRVPILMMGDSELLTPRPWLQTFAKQILLALLFRRVSSFLTVGDNNEAYYASYGVSSKKFFRSPFTIDETSYGAARRERLERRQRVRAQFGVPDDELVFLTVGKMSDRKRPGDVVDTARRLTGQSFASPVRFWLAGEGRMRQPLEEAVKREGLPVQFLGFVDVDRLPDIYAAADVLIHPSERDPHPLVMSEATCVGLPVICSSRVGAVGPTDVLQPGRNVLVYPCGNIDALAERVAQLARDPVRIATMTAATLDVFESQSIRRSVSGLKTALAHAVAPKAATSDHVSVSG